MTEPIITAEYHKAIDRERLSWMHKYFTATEGCITADYMVKRDCEAKIVKVDPKIREELRANAHKLPCALVERKHI